MDEEDLQQVHGVQLGVHALHAELAAMSSACAASSQLRLGAVTLASRRWAHNLGHPLTVTLFKCGDEDERERASSSEGGVGGEGGKAILKRDIERARGKKTARTGPRHAPRGEGRAPGRSGCWYSS